MMENQVAPRDVGGQNNSHLYPIAVLIDELRADLTGFEAQLAAKDQEIQTLKSQ